MSTSPKSPLLALSILAAACAPAEDTAIGTDTGETTTAIEVISDQGEALGFVAFPTSCTEAAQVEIERGLALLHHMNYVNAEPVFLRAAELDPECAIAYWGAAMTYVHPLWPDTISPENREAGEALLARAETAANKSSREAKYVAALQGYYEGAERSERERLASYLAGYMVLHAEYPDDPEAAAFHALGLLANAPAEDKTYALQSEAGEILEGLLAQVPKHPGGHHYTIHAYDFPPLAERALDIARRYDDLAPENTHALHMTSHIFTRLGLWPESIEFNLRAAEASKKRTASGQVSLHHLHAYDYLAYAYLQQARDNAANEVLAKLEALEPPFQNHSATAYTFAAVPARLALERHDWAKAAQVETRWPSELEWDQYPYLDAIPYFARAMGAARTGKPDAARLAIAELGRLEEAAGSLDIAYDWAIQVAIQKTAAQAWLAYESGDVEGGLELARKAAAMEGSTEKNPVTPGEVLPARELYGDMLLEAGRYEEAVAAYERSLERSPNRFNSLYGAGRAAELDGNVEGAAQFYAQLIEVAATSDSDREELEHAHQFVETASAA